MRYDRQRAEDLALLTVLLAATGFLLTLAHVLDPAGLILLVLAAAAAMCSWLALGGPAAGHSTLQAD